MNYQLFLTRMGNAIKRRRKSLGKSQIELSVDADTDQSTISRLERGLQGFDSSLIVRISAALDCPLSDLVLEAEGRFSKSVDEKAVKMDDLFMRLSPGSRVGYFRKIHELISVLKNPTNG